MRKIPPKISHDPEIIQQQQSLHQARQQQQKYPEL
jgi:hypothetical protein